MTSTRFIELSEFFLFCYVFKNVVKWNPNIFQYEMNRKYHSVHCTSNSSNVFTKQILCLLYISTDFTSFLTFYLLFGINIYKKYWMHVPFVSQQWPESITYRLNIDRNTEIRTKKIAVCMLTTLIANVSMQMS